MIFRILLSILMMIACAGCNGPAQTGEQASGSGRPMMARAMPMAAPAAAPMAEMDAAPPPPAPAEAPPQAGNPAERRIMRSANLTIEVKSVESAEDRAKSLAVKIGGFVAGSNSYEDNAGQKAIELSLRVPSDRLDAMLKALREIGRVREEQISGEDITEQYFDLEARLANSRRLETRMLALLETKTQKLKDVLDVERELARVRESIETMEGRKRFWDNRVSLSTLQVTFVQPRGFGRGIFAPLAGSIQRALSAFTASLAWLIVTVSAALPWLALLFAAGWGTLKLLRIWLRHKREAKHRKAQKPE